MIFTETPLKGSYLITLAPFADERGWFTRTYCKKEFEQIGHFAEWVQLNHSATYRKGIIRGMHFQHPPHSEIKLVRCIAGSVYDVILDLRAGSPTFLRWYSIELSAKNKNMLYIPAGFAHGFQTLSENCEMIYHHNSFYKPDSEGGIKYNDEQIDIQWPLPVVGVSERDSHFPKLEKTFTGIKI